MHELLLHSRLRLSSKDEFNDPFDSTLALSEVTGEEAVNFLTDIHRRHVAQDPHPSLLAGARANPSAFQSATLKQMRETLSKVGIYSMSSSIDHPLLWAHYGNSHRGVALVFDHGIDNGISSCLPVRYQDDFPIASLSDPISVSYASLVKGNAWRYESEWRIVEVRKAREWLEIDASSLRGIVFGARCAKEDKDYIHALVERRGAAGLPHLRIHQATIDDKKFELDFVPLAWTRLLVCSSVTRRAWYGTGVSPTPKNIWSSAQL